MIHRQSIPGGNHFETSRLSKGNTDFSSTHRPVATSIASADFRPTSSQRPPNLPTTSHMQMDDTATATFSTARLWTAK